RRLLVVRRLLNESDNWLGSGDLARTVSRLYDLIDRTRLAANGELRRQLLDVAALYAEFAGWLHQEVGDVRGAIEWTERALQQALAADDRELVAYVYLRMGQLAGGDGDRVIGLARAAQREYGLSHGWPGRTPTPVNPSRRRHSGSRRSRWGAARVPYSSPTNCAGSNPGRASPRSEP